MNSPIKTLFIVGIAVVGGSALLVKSAMNNRTKIKTLIQSVIRAWEKSGKIEKAHVVRTSPLDEVKSDLEIQLT